jgi:hypothetical protein
MELEENYHRKLHVPAFVLQMRKQIVMRRKQQNKTKKTH